MIELHIKRHYMDNDGNPCAEMKDYSITEYFLGENEDNLIATEFYWGKAFMGYYSFTDGDLHAVEGWLGDETPAAKYLMSKGVEKFSYTNGDKRSAVDHLDHDIERRLTEAGITNYGVKGRITWYGPDGNKDDDGDKWWGEGYLESSCEATDDDWRHRTDKFFEEQQHQDDLIAFPMLEEAHNEWYYIRGESGDQEEYAEDLCAANGGNKEVFSLLIAYHDSVKACNSSILYVEDIPYYWDSGVQKFSEALDYWDVDEFVVYGHSSDLMDALWELCYDNWELAGMRKIIVHGRDVYGIKVVRK